MNYYDKYLKYDLNNNSNPSSDIYFIKYQKYKNKYLKSKQQIGGTGLYGINFEGGKIISWETKCKNCIGWANCQIAMDAPFHSRVADESVRKQGRSEDVFGYDKVKFQSGIKKIFQFIKSKYSGIKIIIQIARGRAGIPMYEETLKPVFDQIELDNYQVVYGYRTVDYFDCRDLSEPFVFVNIGMFAVLTNVTETEVGEICTPSKTWSIEKYNPDKKKFVIEREPVDWSNNDKNILSDSEFSDIKKIKLFGIADCMDFITPDKYSIDAINELVKL
jgi:hypothetical protein